jgi:hypothetical protein
MRAGLSHCLFPNLGLEGCRVELVAPYFPRANVRVFPNARAAAWTRTDAMALD